MSIGNTPPLMVYEYNGTARSGKGTIVEGISQVHPEVATDETGADYRALTWSLLSEGQLEMGMDQANVTAQIDALPADDIIDLASTCADIKETAGKDGLYGDDVSGLVSMVAPIAVVRSAVKKGFARRIENVRDDGDHRALLVDGRNLSSVVEKIEGTDLVLRSFVYCNPIEAATRECFRKGLEPGTDEWEKEFSAQHKKISKRNQDDSDRDLDPVRPDEDAIDYWDSSTLREITVGYVATHLFDGDNSKALNALFTPDGNYFMADRVAAGLRAVKQGRQIYLDTTPFRDNRSNSLQAMLAVATRIFDEATLAYHLLNGYKR